MVREFHVRDTLLTNPTLLVGLVEIHSDCDSALVKAYSQVYNGMSIALNL